MQLTPPKINGYRGTVQLFAAGAYIFIGRSYLRPSLESRGNTLHWFTELLPMSSLGFMWITCGLIALVGAFLARPKDGISFAALVFAPAVLCILNAIGWATGYNDSGWEIASMYLFIAGFMFCLSAMQADTDRDKRKVQA